MIKELLYKIFGLEPMPCLVCEVLREQLYHSEAERKELLQRVLIPSMPIEPVTDVQVPKPITPPFMPWRLRQQILEQEDRHKAKVMRDKAKEIADLEKELGVAHDVSSSVTFDK